jgi:hypothetical protein
MPKVLNKRTDEIPEDAIYVGRPSIFGNPFQIGKDGTRAEVVSQFKIYAEDYFQPEDLEVLRGKDLVCWCAPKACHADILLEMANRTST